MERITQISDKIYHKLPDSHYAGFGICLPIGHLWYFFKQSYLRDMQMGYPLMP